MVEVVGSRVEGGGEGLVAREEWIIDVIIIDMVY